MLSRTCVCALLRLSYGTRVVASPDLTWNLSFFALFGAIELGGGVIISCLPAISKFFRHIGQLPIINLLDTKLRSLLGSTQPGTESKRYEISKKASNPRVNDERKPTRAFYRLPEKSNASTLLGTSDEIIFAQTKVGILLRPIPTKEEDSFKAIHA